MTIEMQTNLQLWSDVLLQIDHDRSGHFELIVMGLVIGDQRTITDSICLGRMQELDRGRAKGEDVLRIVIIRMDR